MQPRCTVSYAKPGHSAGFCASGPALFAPAELDDASPVAFGRPSRKSRNELFRGFVFRRGLQAGFATGIRLAVESLGDGGWAAHIADSKNIDLETAALVLNDNLVAAANLARGFGLDPVRLNPAQVARTRSQRARFEKPRRPEPLVHAYRVVHWDCPRAEETRLMISPLPSKYRDYRNRWTWPQRALSCGRLDSARREDWLWS